MERAEINGNALCSHNPAEPLFHLPGGILCKGNDQNFFWPYLVHFYQIFNSFRNGKGFPRTGAGEDQTWPCEVHNRRFLSFIKTHIFSLA